MLLSKKGKIAVILITAPIWLTGCSSDDDGVIDNAPVSRTFTVTIENVAAEYDLVASGSFSTPVGAGGPGPIGPGDAYEASFSAAPGSKLSFATMFVPSNDFFYAPDEGGIALFDDQGMQVTGDITAQVMLWDVGTEINQEPGLGADQPQRQFGPNTGAADPDTMVRLAPDDFANLPAVSDVLMVTLTSTSPTGFTLRIENVSDDATLATSDGNTQAVPLAPGVWAIHTEDGPLFMPDQVDYGEGLGALAEDGSHSGLAALLEDTSGVTHLLAPGAFAVHTADDPLFTADAVALGNGLEALAEDGDPSGLSESLESQSGVNESGVFTTPTGAAGPSPLFPGNTYEFSFTGMPGERLSFATMLVQSNDLFYAPSGMGIELFDGQDAISGDITDMLLLWDAGTETNEEPGIGLNQAPRQTGPDTGDNEDGTVSPVNDGYTYTATSSILSVTIVSE